MRACVCMVLDDYVSVQIVQMRVHSKGAMCRKLSQKHNKYCQQTGRYAVRALCCRAFY